MKAIITITARNKKNCNRGTALEQQAKLLEARFDAFKR